MNPMRISNIIILQILLSFIYNLSDAKLIVNLDKEIVKSEIQSKYDQTLIENKISTLNLHPRRIDHSGVSFVYQIIIISPSEYQLQKPTEAYSFDAGYLGSNGDIFISEPTTSEQCAVFKDINDVALFYLCQSYAIYYYSGSPLPDFLRYGFAAYEAHLNISDTTIRTALNSYGGSISNFDVLADRNNFITNNGLAISFMFGEFMSAYHCWHYYNIINTTSTTIEPAPYWWETETTEKLLSKWNRYLYHRILEPDENLRIKLNKETEHFRFYYRDADSFNFPAFSDTVETAYAEYTSRLNVYALEKLTFFTIPECKFAEINGVPCGNRLTSGTAWETGLNSSCANEPYQVSLFGRHNRHELAHSIQQFIIPISKITQWMIEGFACFYESKGPFTSDVINSDRKGLLESMQKAEDYFNHRPTYDDTRVYPNPDYGYYGLGTYFVDFIYRRGTGDQTIFEVYQNDIEGYKKLGFNTPDTFMNAFYYDFDVRIGQKGMVILSSPTSIDQVYEDNVPLKWVPLDPNVKLDVSISLNDSSHWDKIANSTTETELLWNTPDGFLGQFYIKFSHPDYDLKTVLGPFIKGDTTILSLQYPIGGENLFAGDSVFINWAKTDISSIRIEFSSDNGSSWEEIMYDVSTSCRSYQWLVPSIISDNCKIRITDMTNNIMKSESINTFRIIEANALGGPYKPDENTIVLMHFDGDLDNQSNKTSDGICGTGSYSFSSGISDVLKKCIKANVPITIQHCNNLNLTGDWTIEAWVKTDAFTTNNYQTILTKPGDSDAYQSNYSLLINPSWDNVFHYFYFSGLNNRIGTTAPKPNLDEWYHIMCTRDINKSEIKIVLRDKDLNIVASQSQSFVGNEMFTNSKDLIICENFNGFIDELRISNIVRSYEKPSSPLSPFPQNNAVNIDSDSPVTLSWINGEETERIDLYFGKENPPTTMVLDNVPVVNTYTINNLEASTNYFWKVICKNKYGVTDGNSWLFSTNQSTGFNDSSNKNKPFTIYPNPTKTSLNVITSNLIKDEVSLKIYDTKGQLIYSEEFIPTGEKSINIENIAKGMYIIQYKSGNKIANEKLIIE